MKFELGKYYKHTTDYMLHIIGVLHTTMYGWALIAECTMRRGFVAIGDHEGAEANFSESTEEEWMKNFTK